MSNTTPATTLPPSNPFAALAAGTGASTVPASGNTSWYGLTNADLTSIVGAGETLPAGDAGPVRGPDLDPFGIGVPVPTVLDGNGYTVQQLMDYITSLTPSQISQVQAELANAGYYGTMNSLTSEPQWGSLGQADFTALGRFAKDLIVGTQNGSSPSSVLARATAQWNTSQQNQSSLTPVRDLGKNYTVTNLDPNEAGSMVDQTALKVLGHTLSDADRARLGGWMNDLYTSRQRAADQGDIEQNAMNAQAQAQASDFVDPVTGKALDHNGITAAARSQLGVQYQWGAQQPGKAFDCSGLTQYVYQQNGIKIPRTSQTQWADPNGHNFTDMSQAQPGDLVFFGGDGSGPTHVGVYIGNGMMIDAPHTGSSVEIDNVAAFATSDSLVGFKHYDQVNNTSIASSNLPPGSSQSNEQQAYEFFTGKGLTPEQAAGVVGNLMQESGVNPEESGGGIAQWIGSRSGNATQTGNAQSDLEAQLNNLWDELQGPESGALTALQQAQTPQEAALAFSQSYERPGVPNNQAREANAQNIFSQAQSGGWGASQGSITDANGGRSIISTPNTFTNATDESSAALQASLEAQLRAENPAQAQAHDMTSAYTMLAKSLRDGITVNNS